MKAVIFNPVYYFSQNKWLLPSLVGLVAFLGLSSPAQAGLTLGVEMSPAVCSIYPNYNRLRQCIDGTSVTVNYFDTGNRGNCNGSSSYRLPPLQENVVAKFIPDAYVRQQMWKNYGRCSGMSAPNYFRSITNLASSLRLPNELINSNSYRVNHGRFLQQIAGSNAGLSSQGIRLYCQMNRRNQMVLTHVNVCYSDSGRFAQCGNVKPTTCPNDFNIQGKY